MAAVIAVNEAGYRVGQSHHNARFTDREVDLMLQLRSQGLGWRRLARVFECSKRTVRDICSGKRRAQIPSEWRVVRREGA